MGYKHKMTAQEIYRRIYNRHINKAMFMPVRYTDNAFDNFQIITLLVNEKRLHYVQLTEEQWQEFEKANPTKQFSMKTTLVVEASGKQTPLVDVTVKYNQGGEGE